jgi:hypothetical protein
MDRFDWIKNLRAEKRLHTVVENRLIALIQKITDDYHPIKEPVGLAGGRNDLLLFKFSGKKVLFEVFATAAQVSRDLRILDKTKADIKIAIIIDKEIDARVFDSFLKQNPEDNYPFLFISELFQEPPLLCLYKLREMILGEEDAQFLRMLHAKIPREDFFVACRREGIEVLLKEDIQAGTVTFSKLFTTIVLGKLLKYGMARDRVINLGRWLSEEGLLRYILRNIGLGINMILYTDLLENFSVYNDIDLTDWIRASYALPQPYIIMSLMAVVEEIEEKYLNLKDDAEDHKLPSLYVGMSQVHETKAGRNLLVFIPADVSSIIMLPSSRNPKTPEEYRELTTFLPADVRKVEIPFNAGRKSAHGEAKAKSFTENEIEEKG